MGDHELFDVLQRAMQGSDEAFLQLCQEKGRSVLYLCLQFCTSAQDAERAAQEVFVQMHKQMHTLRSPADFKVWLNKIIFRVCRETRRPSPVSRHIIFVQEFTDATVTG